MNFERCQVVHQGRVSANSIAIKLLSDLNLSLDRWRFVVVQLCSSSSALLDGARHKCHNADFENMVTVYKNQEYTMGSLLHAKLDPLQKWVTPKIWNCLILRF